MSSFSYTEIGVKVCSLKDRKECGLDVVVSRLSGHGYDTPLVIGIVADDSGSVEFVLNQTFQRCVDYDLFDLAGTRRISEDMPTDHQQFSLKESQWLRRRAIHHALDLLDRQAVG